MEKQSKKMGRPRTDRPYRLRKIRFSYLEDTLLRLMEQVQDKQAKLEIKSELAALLAKEKELMEQSEAQKTGA